MDSLFYQSDGYSYCWLRLTSKSSRSCITVVPVLPKVISTIIYLRGYVLLHTGRLMSGLVRSRLCR